MDSAMAETLDAVRQPQVRDFVVDRLEAWGEWNRSGVFTGKYKCTLAAPFSGTPPQEQHAYIPPHIQEVESAILKINQKHRRMVSLIKKRFIRCLTYEQIAQDWNTSPATIGRRLLAAYDLLAPYLHYEMDMLHLSRD